MARGCYKADTATSEKATVKDTHFACLDLQKVRLLPEISGVKSAVFTQRICAYNESFSPLGKKQGNQLPYCGIKEEQGEMMRTLRAVLMHMLHILLTEMSNMFCGWEIVVPEQKLDTVFCNGCHC